MPFGKYRGTALVNVPAIYLLWLFDRGCQHEALRRYILDNMEALKAEARNCR